MTAEPDAQPTVDPRTEADAQIARALQIVVDAVDEDDDAETKARRDYTTNELDTLFFSLGTALIQLRKVPGGKEARDRFYDRAEKTLRLRGRQDLLDKLDAETKVDRITAALDELGVPRLTPEGEPVSPGQPLCVESRVRRLGAERDRLRRPPRADHRRVQRAVTVPYAELTDQERYAVDRHPETVVGVGGMWEVTRWEDSEAVKAVKRAFGDNVDLSDGTGGDHIVRMISAEMRHLDVLRDKLIALAATLRPDGS